MRERAARRIRRRAVLALTLLVPLLLVALAAAAAPVPAQQTDEEVEEQSAEAVCDPVASPDAETLAVGATGTVDGLDVTITETSFQPTIDDVFDEGYLRVDFSMTNTGDEPVDYGGFTSWGLLDLQPGALSATPLDAASSTAAATVAPGDTLTGYVLFAVGYGGGDFRVRYRASIVDDEEVVWSVEVPASEGGPPVTVPQAEVAVPPVPEVGAFENVRTYDIDVEVRPDGRVAFSESIEYDFGGQQRHGIFRDLILRERCDDVYDRVYPLSDVSVSSPTGAPDQHVLEDAPAGTRIKIGDADEYVTGVHTYEVDYVLEGTLNAFADHDELYWDVIGFGWGVQLSEVDVTVSAPAPVEQVACFVGDAGSTAPCETAEIVDGSAHFVEDRLYAGQGMTIAVALPKGVIDPEPVPILDERWSLQRAFALTPATAGGAGLLLAGLLAGWGLLAYRVGRDRQLAGSPIDAAFVPVETTARTQRVPLGRGVETPVQYEPPDGIRPAQLAMLRNEEARAVDVSATIVDLAVRGWLRIEELEPTGLVFKKSDYHIVRVRDDDTGLEPYERTLLRNLVPDGDTYLSHLKDTFASKLRRVISEIYDDSVRRGWFTRRPDQVRGHWRALGLLAVVLSVGLTVALAAWTKLAVLGLPVVLASLVLLFSAGKMPHRTATGTGVLRRIKGFETFITDSEAPRARWAEQRNIFSEYLPYAIVLGCATRWARTFEDLGDEVVAGTDWYVGHGPLSVHVLTTEMSSFAATAGSTLSSTPASTSGGSGGGGFSGGGSSGGGGGGGGGGSW